MDLYVGCVAEHLDDKPGRVGLGYVGVLNGVTVEGCLGYYSNTYIRGILLSLIVPLQERQSPTAVLIRCDMALLMETLQQDKVNRTTPSFNGPVEKPGLSVKHHDLMTQYRLLSGIHDIRFDWLKPHTTHWAMVRAHQLAEQAMQSPTEIC